MFATCKVRNTASYQERLLAIGGNDVENVEDFVSLMKDVINVILSKGCVVTCIMSMMYNGTIFYLRLCLKLVLSKMP